MINGGTVIKKVDPAGALLWENTYSMAGFRVEVGTDNRAVVSGFPDSGTAGAAFLKVDEDGGLLWSNPDADGPLDGSQAAASLWYSSRHPEEVPMKNDVVDTILTKQDQAALCPDDVLAILKAGNEAFVTGDVTHRDHRESSTVPASSATGDQVRPPTGITRSRWFQRHSTQASTT